MSYEDEKLTRGELTWLSDDDLSAVLRLYESMAAHPFMDAPRLSQRIKSTLGFTRDAVHLISHNLTMLKNEADRRSAQEAKATP